MGLGYTPFMTSVVIPYGSTTLKSIYTPGTIVTMLPAYFNKNNKKRGRFNSNRLRTKNSPSVYPS